MKLVKHSPEVFLATGPIVEIGAPEIALLKDAVAQTPRGRVRINAHPDGEDALHEMFIAIRPDSYIRPHKHPGKSEAFHIVYGAVDVVVFDDAGDLLQIVKLGAPDSGRAFYYRMSKPHFHTLIIRSDLLIVHEITNGPFRSDATLQADFAPAEGDAAAGAAYSARLAERAAAFADG